MGDKLNDLDTNLKTAERFLLWAHPAGPWVLTAIPVEGGRTTTETFRDIEEALAWVEKFSGKQNVYFTVNRVRGDMDVKPKKEHIEEAVMLHVDVDPAKPPAGLDAAQLAAHVQKEQARILKALEEFSPSPSAIIFSGGGYQGFWMLDDPFYIGGDNNRINDLEAYNRQIQLLFNADSCFNVDRIMRLPGTINLPDEKKRKKGRVPARAEIVELSGVTYPLHDFTPAPEVQSSNSGSGIKVQISGNLPRLKDLDELPEAVTPRTRMLIVQGDDPDDPTRYGSKSEVMWAVTCELIRAGCENDMIAAVLLDPDFGVSDHPLRQKRSVEYVARQIERAREDNDAGGRRVLDPTDPYRTAIRLLEEELPDTIYTNGDFLRWKAGAYRSIEDGSVKSMLWRVLAAAVARVKRDDTFVFEPIKPTINKVNEVFAAMAGRVHRPADAITPPVWLDGDGPPPGEIVALSNGLLHLPTGELLPPTPRFFTRNALGIAFDAEAPPAVEWRRFVEQVFPDPAAAGLLQEWLGYLLLPDVSQHKIMLLVGPPRSGKGVIQHVITALVGASSVCAPSGNSLAGNNVGALQPLIGATVAFLTDARFGGRADKVAITANLLAISGGDRITIDRKYKAPWDGVLSARLVIMSNELPGLRDNSPALANRFTPLVLEKSFLGREDHGLAQRIIANELPGVLLWALDGWRRLHERGHFLLAQASEDAIAEILDLGSPVAAFLNARCDLGEGRSVGKERLYRVYRAWCEATEQRAVASNVFSRDLGTATGGKVRPSRTRVGARDGGKLPVFAGVDLRDEPGPDGGNSGPAGLPFGSEAHWEREPY